MRKEIISNIVSDELTKPTGCLILLQIFQNKNGRIQPENIFKNSFCSKMFQRKMIQTSVEPAENKSFSSADVNCTVCELAVWHKLPERTSETRKTVINFGSALHGATTGIIFTYSFF